MNGFFNGKNILVTGGSGFIGSNLIESLIKKGAKVSVTVHNNLQNIHDADITIFKGDLTDYQFCMSCLRDIDYVFHLASQGFSSIIDPMAAKKNFTPNMLIDSNLIHAASKSNISHFLYGSSLNVYDSNSDIFSDEMPWCGEPHNAQKFLGWCKRMGELQVQTLHEIGIFKSSIVRIGAAYGPRDNFDSQTARVIPSLISKIYDDNDTVTVWGAGNAERSFIFVDDVVDAMCLCMERYSEADPINVGSAESTSIKKLIYMISQITNSDKKIVFDTSKPEGIKKINMTTHKAKKKLNWEAKIPLETGLRLTVSWYVENILKKQKVRT